MDPVQFARVVLRHKTWSVQDRILRAISQKRRVAVKACHASGKSYSAAEVALWWITRFQNGIVITTAPSWNQVEKVLWGQNILPFIAAAKLRYPEPTLTELRMSPTRYAMGLSTNQGVRFQGFHGRILIIIDEAPGVDAGIWEAIEGIRAGGDVRVLALGNPTVPGGPFHEAFTNQRSGWHTVTISAFDVPNLAGCKLEYPDPNDADSTIVLGDPNGIDLRELSARELDRNVLPYLTTRRWVLERFHEWGPENSRFQSRVLGRFPLQAEDALLSLAWLEAAQIRELPAADEPIKAGLDVAGPGEDETCLYVRQGPRILKMKAWHDPDPRGQVLAELAPLREELAQVNVDTAGIGYYLAKHLEDHGLPVVGVNVGESPNDSERYLNLKAELYWGLRDRIEDGDMAGLIDETTIGQLASIRYKHNARGQVVIESKEDARKRGVKSPDRAEALMLAFAHVQNPNDGIFSFYRNQSRAK